MMRLLVRAASGVLAAGVPAFYAMSGQALAQTMDVSTYNDSFYELSNDIFYSIISTVDNSTGCYHDSYQVVGYLRSPSGRFASEWGGGSAWASLPFQEEFGDWETGGSGTVYCSCIYSTFGYGGPSQTIYTSPHVTYYKTPIVSDGVCLYTQTNCLIGSTAVCTGGVLPPQLGINPPNCPPFIRVAYLRMREGQEAYCVAVGAQAITGGGACS